LAVVTMKNLLESGVHFGHQTKRWDPRMKKYIFAERNGIHIIDLQKTIVSIKDGYDAVRKIVLEGKSILFIGTKKQAQTAVEREASNCGMFYVNNRWLGGMLTNFETIKRSLLRLKKLEKMEVDGTFDSLSKKEISKLNKEKARLQKNLGGIKEMKELPGMVFIIDTKKETIAVAEAQRMGIPIVAVVDTNCNPEGIDHPIPGNDDAIRAISLFAQIISKAVIEADNEIGLEVIETLQDEDEVKTDDVIVTAPLTAESPEDGDKAVVEPAPFDGDIEKVSVAAQVGTTPADEEKAEEDASSFSAEDYSDYTPGEEPVVEKPAPQPEADIPKEIIDEDKLYEE
jgi:small subunit ribosomal protein S2